jgi:hypothetical protein
MDKVPEKSFGTLFGKTDDALSQPSVTETPTKEKNTRIIHSSPCL